MILGSKALIITVNYRGAESTLEFLNSASHLEAFDHADLLVVDNNSGDDSVARMQKTMSQFSNVAMLESEVNRGYFGGANWALQQYLAHGFRPDWILSVTTTSFSQTLNSFSIFFNGTHPRSLFWLQPSLPASPEWMRTLFCDGDRPSGKCSGTSFGCRITI